MCMCVCVRVCVCLCECMCVCTHVCVCVCCMCVCVRVFVGICVCMSVSVVVCVCVCVWVPVPLSFSLDLFNRVPRKTARAEAQLGQCPVQLHSSPSLWLSRPLVRNSPSKISIPAPCSAPCPLAMVDDSSVSDTSPQRKDQGQLQYEFHRGDSREGARFAPIVSRRT